MFTEVALEILFVGCIYLFYRLMLAREEIYILKIRIQDLSKKKEKLERTSIEKVKEIIYGGDEK